MESQQSQTAGLRHRQSGVNYVVMEEVDANRLTLVRVFTDGACSGNPGPGAWAALLRFENTEKEIAGGERLTTNNRMELVAVIEGLQALRRPCKVELYTDSKYVVMGINEWVGGWRERGWRTAGGHPVKNVDLWKRLEIATARHEVGWHWIKGHSGHPENERVDGLARRWLRDNVK